MLAGLAVGCAQETRSLVVVTFRLGAGVPPLSEMQVFFATKKARVTDSLPTASDPVELGFFVPGVEGTVSLRVDGLDAAGCIVARKQQNVPLNPGHVVPVEVILERRDPKICPPSDAGVQEAGTEAGVDADAGADADADSAAPMDAEAGADTHPDVVFADASDAVEAGDAGVDADASDAGDGAASPDAVEAGPSEAGPTGPTCKSYCAALAPKCTSYTLVETEGGAAGCEKLCDLFFPAPAGGGPNVGLTCRTGYLSMGSVNQVCGAGLGAFSGGGFCGVSAAPGDVWCDVYCSFAGTTCDRFGMTPAQCLQSCSFLQIPLGNNPQTGDNVQCRVRQLIAAGGLQGAAHTDACASAAIAPNMGPCR